MIVFLLPIFSFSFLCKKHQGKLSRAFEAKWFYVAREYEDNVFKDILFKPETNIKRKLAHWKYVSMISLLL
jgi:hypothetical protein